jgi:hypothetical protein
MSLILISLRTKGIIQDKKFKDFSETYEEHLFEYIESNEHPSNFLEQIKERKIPLFLRLVRDYAVHLRGRDFERLSGLINSPKIFNFLRKDLRSNNKKRVLRAIYFFGLSRNQASLIHVKEALKSQNDVIKINAALSLAKMNAGNEIVEIVKSLLTLKHATNDLIISILVEFDPAICSILESRLDIAKNDRVRAIYVSVFTKFRFIPAAKKVLYYLQYGTDPELTLSCLKYFMVIEYEPAGNALKFVLLKSSPTLLAYALKAAARIGTKELEEIIYEKLFVESWQTKLDSAAALYEISKTGKDKLNKLAYDLDHPAESAIARMVLSEKEISGK